MTRLLFIALPLSFALAGAAHAQCYGPPNFQTCEDEFGNRFEISRIGNQTMVRGYDAYTGNNWRRQDYQLGSTTLSSGTTPWGESWRTQSGPNGYFHADGEGSVAAPPRD